MCCMNVNCGNCLVNLEWTLIYLQKINPTQKIRKKVHSFGYRKSSIKPPPGGGGVFISNTFEGGLNREGGRIWEAGLFDLPKIVVSVLLKELEYKVKSSSTGRLEVMQPRPKGKSEFPTREQTMPDRSNWSFTIMIDYSATGKTGNPYISGMFIVFWPITAKIKTGELATKPQTN